MTANDEAADRMEEDVLFHKPLIVLADDATASAAEAVVQALKENKRGRFVGVRTYGKAVGYYQKALPNGGVLQVTGLDMVNGWANGIEPDVLVEQPRGESTVDVQLQAGIQALEKLIGAAAAPAAKH
jgi:C-terminal processing protease CtpA/Prc